MHNQSLDQILSAENLPRIIDISALSVSATEDEIDKLAQIARNYGFIAVFVLPGHIEYLAQKMTGSNVILGAPIGFPTGADLSVDKAFQVRELMKIGCTEFDMVINVGKLKSGRYDYVRDDIAGVVDAAQGYPVKVILEVTYLTDDEIKTGSEIVARSGADYVKTGTGFSSLPTLPRHVDIMRDAVGDSIKIKVAGGVRDYKTLCDFYSRGATRFGIGVKAAMNILKEAGKLPATDISRSDAISGGY
jgi:deoxyribose-phosphate aldolase